MKSSGKFVSAIGLAGLIGCAGGAGMALERHRHGQFVVKATTALEKPSPFAGGYETSLVLKEKSQRISQIMRHGYPSLDTIRTYDNFVLSYDRRNRTANWVFEHLTPDLLKQGDNVDRAKSEFHEDGSVHNFFRANNTDYKGSGYDRGHLAAAGNHRVSQRSVDQTFVLSNISPQVGRGFNRDAWNSLEKYVRYRAKYARNLWVCTGPAYLPRPEPDGKSYVKYQVIGSNHVAVPTHFFKVLVTENEAGEFDLEAFLMPNRALDDKIPLKAYQVPPDSIERVAGLLFFSEIPRSRFKSINGKSKYLDKFTKSITSR